MYDNDLTVHRIKYLLSKKGLTLGEMNEKCNLTRTTISNSAKTKTGLNAKNLFAIASFLDCSADYLLGLTDNPERNK